MGKIYDADGNILYPDDGLSGLEDLRTDRTLVWHEEFNGSELDAKNWSHLTGAYKADIQRYWMSDDVKKNAYTNNGGLYLTNLRDYPHENIAFSGAFIHTHGKFEFKYGLLEAKIKYPDAPAYHATFWTLATNYIPEYLQTITNVTPPQLYYGNYGEMDIAECDKRNVSCAFHCRATSSFGYHELTTGTSWHIYGLEWTESGAKIYLDRQLITTVSFDPADFTGYVNAFKKAHYIVLNMNPWLDNLSSQTEDFLETQVAWIRVYAPVGVDASGDIETAVVLDKSDITLTVGTGTELVPTFTPNTVTNVTLDWESYNTNVAEVRGGDVFAVGVGTTYVRATSKNGCVAYCKVTVTE